jgi:hypothetical protein
MEPDDEPLLLEEPLDEESWEPVVAPFDMTSIFVTSEPEKLART